MANELTIIIRGMQGAGKTTLAQALAELLSDRGVEVFLMDEDQRNADFWDGLSTLEAIVEKVGMRVKIETEVG